MITSIVLLLATICAGAVVIGVIVAIAKVAGIADRAEAIADRILDADLDPGRERFYADVRERAETQAPASADNVVPLHSHCSSSAEIIEFPRGGAAA